MAFETIEVHQAQTVRGFFKIIQRKRHVALATGSWMKIHLSTTTPFGRGPTLTAMLEGEGDVAVQTVVLLGVRASFDEEHAVETHARLFRDWRRMMHDGQLVRCLDLLFNEFNGDLDRLPEHLSGLRQEALRSLEEVQAAAESLHLATQAGDAENTLSRFRGHAESSRRLAERMGWCLFYEQLRGYLADGQHEQG